MRTVSTTMQRTVDVIRYRCEHCDLMFDQADECGEHEASDHGLAAIPLPWDCRLDIAVELRHFESIPAMERAVGEDVAGDAWAGPGWYAMTGGGDYHEEILTRENYLARLREIADLVRKQIDIAEKTT